MARHRQWPPRPTVHKPSGQERVRVGSRDIYLGKAGSEEARKNYADLVAKLAEQKPPELRRAKSGATVAEVVDAFQSEADERYDPEGREAPQFRYACAPLVRRHGGTAAGRFGTAELEQVRDDMIKLGWLRDVINRRIVRVRTVFRWAERRGLAPAGKWAELRALEPLARNDRRVSRGPARTPASWDELQKVLGQCKDNLKALLLVLWHTGARPSELRTLRAKEVDASGEIWLARKEQHKNAWRGQERVIPIGPRAQEVLRPKLEGLGPDDFVFATEAARGPGHYSENTLAQAVARACSRAGVKLTPYSLRHAAKQRFTREMGLDAARSALGQASILSTDRYAAQQDLKLASEVAQKSG